jgi:hypothetical protein
MPQHTPQLLTRAKDAMTRLYRCEKGAEGLEKLLIIGAIVIPLLGLLIFFRNELRDWTTSAWDDVKSDSDDFDADF